MAKVDAVATKIVGVVKWFNAQKGYGFISPDNGEKDVFVHYSELKMDGYKTVKENDRVEFSVGHGPKGPQAEGVVRL